MEELMAALKATESSLKSVESEFQQSKKLIDDNEDPAVKRRRNMSTGMIDLNSAKKVVQKASPVVGFSKTQRFKTPNNQDLDSSRGSVDSSSTNDSSYSIGAIRTKSPVILFGKAQRFQQEKKETNREFDLNPKYETVKKREPSAFIMTPTKSPLKSKTKKPVSTKENQPQNHDESMETVRLENIEREAPSFSDTFSDTTEILGPGKYDVKYSAIEVRKSVGFPKSARFKMSHYDEGTIPLNPKYDAIKKGVPGVKIAKEVPKNEKLLLKNKKEEFYQDLSNQIRREKPLDNDVGVRRNVPRVIMKDASEGMSEKERLLQIFNLLSKRREERKVAPGTYEPQDQYEPICTVVYRKSLSPKVLRQPERPPSPTRYYAKDDLVKPSQPAFSFFKEGIEYTPKLEDFDMRKPLDINLNLVKPRIPAAVILPEQKEEQGPELEDIKRGPGAYHANYELTEKRADIGVMKFPELNENNMRENQVDLANKDAVDADLDPNYDVNKPRAPAFVYHKPVELEGPTHLPESVLHPEQWKFYDPDLNAIKPELGDIEFAGGLTREEFMEKEDDHNQFLAYQNRKNNKRPEAGQYNVKYGAIEPEPKAPDFDKYLEREGAGPEKEELELPGDILILEPEKPKPHLPNIKFDTMKGREEEKGPDTEELILNPSYGLVKPKTVTLVDMSKQMDRTDLYGKTNENDEELILDVNYNQIDPKIKGIPDLAKLTTREHLEATRNDEKEELIITPSHDLVKESVKVGVHMDSKTKRFPNEPEKDLKDGRETTDQRIDYNKTLDAVKPDRNIVDFDRYSERDLTKEAKKKKLEELNKKLMKGNLAVIEEENFEKYPGEAGGEEKNDKKKNILIRQNNLTKKVKASEKVNKTKEEPQEKNEIEPWGDQEGEDLQNY